VIAVAMAVRIVRLGSARGRGEGLRIGTVRHPPRGVPKDQHAAQNWYDVWLPELAPSSQLVKFAQAADSPRQWATNFSVGCYCTDETHCHRSVLRALLKENGGTLA
jgi:uncharacterized protein YeaO (DUF488 family)